MGVMWDHLALKRMSSYFCTQSAREAEKGTGSCSDSEQLWCRERRFSRGRQVKAQLCSRSSGTLGKSINLTELRWT